MEPIPKWLTRMEMAYPMVGSWFTQDMILWFQIVHSTWTMTTLPDYRNLNSDRTHTVMTQMEMAFPTNGKLCLAHIPGWIPPTGLCLDHCTTHTWNPIQASQRGMITQLFSTSPTRQVVLKTQMVMDFQTLVSTGGTRTRFFPTTSLDKLKVNFVQTQTTMAGMIMKKYDFIPIQ